MNNTLDIINESSFFAQQKKKAQFDEIQKQKEYLEKRKEIKEKTKEQIEESKKKGEYDWTRSYRIWDLEEDEDFVNSICEKQEYAKKELQSVVSQYETDHSEERKFNDKPTREKLDMCHSARKKGHAFYNEGLYTRAAGQYRLALVYCDYIYPETGSEEDEEYKEMMVSCSLNLAQCKLKTEEYKEVIDNCNVAIELDNVNYKAYFRRAIAYRSTHRFDEAKDDFEMALKCVESKDETWKKKIQKEYDVLKYMIKSANVKTRIMSKRMFNSEDDRKISEDEYIAPSKNDSTFYDCRIKNDIDSENNNSSLNISSQSISSQVLQSNSNSISKLYNTLFYTLQLIMLSFIHGCAYLVYKTFRCERVKSYEEENKNTIESNNIKEKNE